MQKYLSFTVDEYLERARKIVKRMGEQGMDGMVFTKAANLMYFTGYTTTLYNSQFRPFLAVFPASGDPVLIVPNLEYGGAVKTTWIEDVRMWGNTKGCAGKDPVELLQAVMVEKGLSRSKVGIELGNGHRLGMTMEQYMRLRELLPGVEFVDSSNAIWDVRMVKSPAEIEYIRKSCQANDMGFQAAVDAIRQGATEKEVACAMARAMVEGGAVPDFLTVAAGPNRYDMMNPYASESVVIRDGDMVVMDFGCRYEGYYSDVTRGVFVGKVHPRAAELYKAVRDINEHALEAAKPGNPISAIDAAAEKRIRELGYADLMLHRTGHALGLEVHENPSIGPTEHTPLKEGMVLAVEPGLYDFSVGAFRIENNIVITKDGFEYLTHASQDIIVK